MSEMDRTYIINLAHRTDRWEHIQAEMAKVGIEGYERFNAYGVDNPPPARYTAGIPGFKMSGWYGNKFSHYGAIERAASLGCEDVMVVEDDATFHPQFNEIVEAAMGQLPDYWDWLAFGGNHRYFGGVSLQSSPIDGKDYVYPPDGFEPYSPNLARIRKMLTAHAYIARASVFQFILSHAIASPLSIDGFYAYEVHNRFKCYCVVPCVAKQIPGMNDIGGVYSDYTPYIGD